MRAKGGYPIRPIVSAREEKGHMLTTEHAHEAPGYSSRQRRRTVEGGGTKPAIGNRGF